MGGGPGGQAHFHLEGTAPHQFPPEGEAQGGEGMMEHPAAGQPPPCGVDDRVGGKIRAAGGDLGLFGGVHRAGNAVVFDHSGHKRLLSLDEK